MATFDGQDVPPPDELKRERDVRNRWFEANLAVKLYLAYTAGPERQFDFGGCLQEAEHILLLAKAHVFAKDES